MRQAYIDALESDIEEMTAEVRACESLAGVLRVSEQTIQRYEATEYQGVALVRLTRVAEALSVRVMGMYATA
jgi:hypothetical protein